MTETNPQPATRNSVSADEASLIWDEYKYRHQHCWNTIFKLTGSAVGLGLVPYLDTTLQKGLGYWLLSPPLLAIALIGFGMLRFRHELRLLDQVKSVHRERQRALYAQQYQWQIELQSTFDRHVWSYLGILLVLAIVNAIIAYCWTRGGGCLFCSMTGPSIRS